MLPGLITLLFSIIFLTASGALAQEQNIIGLKVLGEHPMEHCAAGADGAVHSFEIYIYNPVNSEFGSQGVRPVGFVSGFECRLLSKAVVGELQIVGLRFPGLALNVGTNSNIIVGYSEPVSVSAEGATVLATVDFVLVEAGEAGPEDKRAFGKVSPSPCDEGRAWVFLSPTERPSVPGLMAYLDAEDSDNPLVPASSPIGWESPAYTITDGSVATVSQTWGNLKALYR